MDSLKAVCTAVGVRAAGRREELIERILTGSGGTQMPTAKQRGPKRGEETTKPDRRIQKELALHADNGNGRKLDVSRLASWL